MAGLTQAWLTLTQRVNERRDRQMMGFMQTALGEMALRQSRANEYVLGQIQTVGLGLAREQFQTNDRLDLLMEHAQPDTTGGAIDPARRTSRKERTNEQQNASRTIRRIPCSAVLALGIGRGADRARRGPVFPVSEKMVRQIGVMEKIIDRLLLDSENFLVYSGNDNARGLYIPRLRRALHLPGFADRQQRTRTSRASSSTRTFPVRSG